MSNYELRPLPGEPIVVGTLFDGFSYQNDMVPYLDELAVLLDSAPAPFIYINDLRGFSPTLTDLIEGSNVVSRGTGALMHHPNFKLLVLVTKNAMIRLAVRGMNSPVFGFVRAEVFETLDEAFDFARSQV